MSAHDDLVTAAKSLRDHGRIAVSLADILSTTRHYASTCPDAVLRSTMMTMLESGENGAQDGVVFVEVGHGYYRMTH
ncbi:MAG TPA: hypothetical protein VIJ86_02365 [Acidimicrobiales bacterium]